MDEDYWNGRFDEIMKAFSEDHREIVGDLPGKENPLVAKIKKFWVNLWTWNLW